MRHVRRILLLFLFFALAGGVWAAIYVQKKGFFGSWRGLIEDEFAERLNFYPKIGKVTLGPLQGLVAEEVYFYWDPEHKQQFAFVESMILDLDLTEVLNRELSINTLDVQDARLSLPLSPKKKDSEMLEIDRFSGRLVVTESQIEIVKAIAGLQGIEITLKGSLHRLPEEPVTPFDPDAAGEERDQRRRLQELGQQIATLKNLLQEMEFDPFELPRIEVEFSGDLADLGGMRASARLFAENFQRESYPVQALTASMEYDGEKGRALLKELHLRDSEGDLRLRADWPIGGREITFDLDSNANLPALAASIFEDPRLREVVFFDPPRLKMEGTVKLDEIEGAEFSRLPVEAIGHFSSDGFVSRGTIFDGLELNFSISGDRAYVRNLRLEHQKGTLQANLMFDPALGSETFRYQSEMNLDPKIFKPFVNSPDAQRFLSMWEFNRNSDILVAAMGSGPDLNPDNWNSRGFVDLRRLRLNNVRFNRLESNFEFRDGIQSYSEVRLAGAEGLLVAPEAIFHVDSKRWDVKDLKWSLDLDEGVRAFSPSLADELKRHQFTKRPEVRVTGTIDSRSNEELGGSSREHDFDLKFESDQPLRFDFMGQTLSLQNPKGEAAVTGESFHLSKFNAGLFGGTVSADLHSKDGESRNGTVTIREADLFSIPVFRPLLQLVRDTIPAEKFSPRNTKGMSATLDWKDGILATDNLKAEAGTIDFSAKGRIDSVKKSIQFDATADLNSEPAETHRFSGKGSFGDPKWKVAPSAP